MKKFLTITLAIFIMLSTVATYAKTETENIQQQLPDFVITAETIQTKIEALGEITDNSKINEIFGIIRLYKLMSAKEAAKVNNFDVLKKALETSASFYDQDDIKLRIMSFNVRTGETQEDRLNRVVTQIKQESPDSFGVQEAWGRWTRVIKENLGDEYEEIGHGRDEMKHGETSNIYYKRDKFDLLDSGTIWLTETPHVYSCYYNPIEKEDDTPRIMTYAVLKRKSDGAVFIHANTHLSADTSLARETQGYWLIDYLKYTFEFDYPIVLTGDFNEGEGSGIYNLVVGNGFTPSDLYGEKKRTFHGYGSSSTYIDFCFANEYVPIVGYKVCDEQMDGQWVSDHNAVIGEVLILPETADLGK